MIGVWRVWRTTIVTAIGAVALLNAPCADAQEKWPSRPVTLVVPVGAGTITDVAGRLLADHLKDIFGQPFVVENKAGAGATLGARYVARAQPDGYTLLVGGNTTHSAVPSLFKSAPYDPVADFTPIARVGLLGQFLCTNTQQPFKTIQEMAAFAKANPGKLSYGHGNASGQIVGETLKSKLGFNIVRVPYSSNPTALTDLLSNSIQLMAIDYLNGVPLAESRAYRFARRVHQGSLCEAAEHADARRDGDPGIRTGAVARPVRPTEPAARRRRADVQRARQDRRERDIRQKPGEAWPRAVLHAKRAVCHLREGGCLGLDRARPDCWNRAEMNRPAGRFMASMEIRERIGP